MHEQPSHPARTEEDRTSTLRALGSSSGIGHFVRGLFLPNADDPAVDAKVAASVAGFLRATRTNSDVPFDALTEDFLSSRVPSAPGAVAHYVDRLQRDVVEHATHTSSPNYIGHMTAALPSFVRQLSRLVTALNQNVVKIETAKSLTPYEREALAMLHRLAFARDEQFYEAHMQARSSTLGMVTSGGTIANVTALWIARNAAFGSDGAFPGVERVGLGPALAHHGARRAVVVGSALMHYSLEKGADLLGIGSDALVRVPVDANGRVRTDELRRTVEACKARGDRVLAVVGVAGTTESGACDALVDLAAIASEAGAHFHVDAAWGGPLLLSPEHRDKLAGIELADSVTIDGHKQLYLPMGIGMLLLREPVAAKVIEKQAQYIIRADSPDLGRRSLEGSRPAMALYLHAALHILGADGYAWLMNEGLRKARWMADRICGRAEFELIAAPETNIVNYRYLPAQLRERAKASTLSPAEQAAINKLNERLQERQRDAGRTFASRTTLRYTRHGENVPITVLRAILANPLTTEAHIDGMLEDQAEIGADLSGEELTRVARASGVAE